MQSNKQRRFLAFMSFSPFESKNFSRSGQATLKTLFQEKTKSKNVHKIIPLDQVIDVSQALMMALALILVLKMELMKTYQGPFEVEGEINADVEVKVNEMEAVAVTCLEVA